MRARRSFVAPRRSAWRDSISSLVCGRMARITRGSATRNSALACFCFLRNHHGAVTCAFVVVIVVVHSACSDYASITTDFSISIVNHLFPEQTEAHSFKDIVFPLPPLEGQGLDTHGTRTQSLLLLSRLFADCFCGIFAGHGEDFYLSAISRQSGFLDEAGRLVVQSMFQLLNVQFKL